MVCDGVNNARMQNYIFPGIEMQSIIDQISCFCLVTIDQISHLHDQLQAYSCTIGGGWFRDHSYEFGR